MVPNVYTAWITSRTFSFILSDEGLTLSCTICVQKTPITHWGFCRFSNGSLLSKLAVTFHSHWGQIIWPPLTVITQRCYHWMLMKPACFNGWAVIITFIIFLILDSAVNRWWKSCKTSDRWSRVRRTEAPSRLNSPQPEDASGPRVCVDMWASRSSAFGPGCLHRCRHDTLQWPHYGPLCRCRRRWPVNLCFPNMMPQLLTLFLLLPPSAWLHKTPISMMCECFSLFK